VEVKSVGRSTEKVEDRKMVEVQKRSKIGKWSKYRRARRSENGRISENGRRSENGRSTEEVQDRKMVEVQKRSNWCVPEISATYMDDQTVYCKLCMHFSALAVQYQKVLISKKLFDQEIFFDFSCRFLGYTTN